MIRTYLDTNVLITASLGRGDDLRAALGILDATDREFVSSVFLKLEILPKPVRNKQTSSLLFYEVFFGLVKACERISNDLMELALYRGCALVFSAMDALRLAAAHSIQTDEFSSLESP